ncbi:MAG TPA: hypothetical protein DEB32_10835 [Stenotrophomonas sp.]|uniref:hypothetical protein n=1 Tax=Stenotrophomonas sp. TaxID=69392 RepID=UPI000E8B98AF|nr:hypothetical protein [Stenotrophomonas sp.]HBS63190.1 hypothetical protein [Stenotrophomonas sp.]
MSAPVDVLAVLDRAFGAAHEHYDDLKSAADEPALGPAYHRACRYMAEHREARAAVAELIEAVEATRATRGGIMGLGAQDARTVRLWNAVARAKGGAA